MMVKSIILKFIPTHPWGKFIYVVGIILLVGIHSNTIAQKGIGYPLIRNFTPREYQAEVRNWAMVQDNRGVMFIGNNAGVLKFDGNTWRLIQVNGTIVRSKRSVKVRVCFYDTPTRHCR